MVDQDMSAVQPPSRKRAQKQSDKAVVKNERMSRASRKSGAGGANLDEEKKEDEGKEADEEVDEDEEKIPQPIYSDYELTKAWSLTRKTINPKDVQVLEKRNDLVGLKGVAFDFVFMQHRNRDNI